jgi:hypothetical protein
LADVVRVIDVLMMPPVLAAASRKRFDRIWVAGAGWLPA